MNDLFCKGCDWLEPPDEWENYYVCSFHSIPIEEVTDCIEKEVDGKLIYQDELCDE